MIFAERSYLSISEKHDKGKQTAAAAAANAALFIQEKEWVNHLPQYDPMT
jgi:hypothetical protein